MAWAAGPSAECYARCNMVGASPARKQHCLLRLLSVEIGFDFDHLATIRPMSASGTFRTSRAPDRMSALWRGADFRPYEFRQGADPASVPTHDAHRVTADVPELRSKFRGSGDKIQRDWIEWWSDCYGRQSQFSVVAGPGFGPILGLFAHIGSVFGIGGFGPGI
jgi:hypothetical protein